MPAIDNTMGAAFIGVVCAGILYGISALQSFIYFESYPEDPVYIKLTVALLWIFDTVHQALISHTIYHYVITNFSRQFVLGNMVWSVLLEVLFNGLIAIIVQFFLLVRVWHLSGKNWYLTGFIALLTVAGFVTSLVFTACSLELVTWLELTTLKGLSMTINVLGAAIDCLIAGCLFWFLHKSRTGFKRSDTMIRKLIMFSVSTGFLTSMCAIASLISILVWGDTLIYVAFYFTLGRLYTNSVLATLNARKKIRALEHTEHDLSLMSISRSLQSDALRGRMPRQRPEGISIHCTVDTVHDFKDGASMDQKVEQDISDAAEVPREVAPTVI